MRFELSRRADSDISAIYLYGCAEFGMAQADAYTDGLFATIRFLAETPYAARERREFRRPVRCFRSGRISSSMPWKVTGC